MFLKTDMPLAPAKGRRIIAVPEGSDLQRALDDAIPGDVIELARGGLYVGNFTLPVKTGPGWVIIRPANHADLPREGTRMTPTIASRLQLPRLISPNASPTIRSTPGAHHYRFVGLDVGVRVDQKQNYGVIVLDGGDRPTKMSDLPHDITLDRLFVHGNDQLSLRRCIGLNSASSAVVDSWLSNCHDKDSDSQAIAGFAGAGPFKIVNNYLEGATENVAFGGTDPTIPGLVPSDIEFRRNHVTKPTYWKDVWLAKNLIELKNAQRMLIEGNIFENSWQHGQSGEAFVFWSANQDGRCTWCVTRDITMRLNIFRNIGSVGIISGQSSGHPSISANRFVFTDNIFTNIDRAPFNGNGRGFAFYHDAHDILVAHNTVVSPTTAGIVFGAAPILGLTIRDNIIDGGKYGIVGDGVAGPQALAKLAPGYVLKGNALILGDGGQGFQLENLVPLNVNVIRFADLPSGDVTLPESSPLKRRAPDGTDTGANVAAVKAATDGVRVRP